MWIRSTPIIFTVIVSIMTPLWKATEMQTVKPAFCKIFLRTKEGMMNKDTMELPVLILTDY